MGNGRFEAKITLATAQAIAMGDLTGSFTATVAAGDYYLAGPSPATAAGELPGLVEAWFNAVGAASKTGWDFAVSTDFRVTVSRAGGTCSVTWNAASAEMKRIMGFSSDIAATGQQGEKQMESVWLAPVRHQSLNHLVPFNASFDEFRGWLEHDFNSVENFSGLTSGFVGSSAYVRSFTFPTCIRSRVWIAHETLANESFEHFAFGCLMGRFPWATCGGPVRWHRDQAFSGSDPAPQDLPSQYTVILGKDFIPQPVTEQDTSLWQVHLDRCILIPELFV